MQPSINTLNKREAISFKANLCRTNWLIQKDLTKLDDGFYFTLRARILHHIASLKILEATSSSCVLSPCTLMQYSRLRYIYLAAFGIIALYYIWT